MLRRSPSGPHRCPTYQNRFDGVPVLLYSKPRESQVSIPKFSPIRTASGRLSRFPVQKRLLMLELCSSTSRSGAPRSFAPRTRLEGLDGSEKVFFQRAPLSGSLPLESWCLLSYAGEVRRGLCPLRRSLFSFYLLLLGPAGQVRAEKEQVRGEIKQFLGGASPLQTSPAGGAKRPTLCRETTLLSELPRSFVPGG